MNVDTEKLSLTIDEYLSIFMYIIVRSRLKDLEAHLLFIDSFLDEFKLFATKEG